MTIDERIQALTINLELLSHDHEALRQEGRDQRQRIEMLITAAEKLQERMGALTMNLELVSHQQESQGNRIELLITAAQQDGEHIRALARIAESHQRRLTELEGESSRS